MARRKPIADNGVSLFPFMSILACLIGILTLMISVISRAKEEQREGWTEEQRELAEANRDLRLELKKLEKQLAEKDKQLERDQKDASELKKLKDRQIVLRKQLDELSKAKDPDKTDEELQKIVENLKTELEALKKEKPPLEKRLAELQKQLKERKEAPEPPKSVQVRPGGTSLNAARNIFFVECNETGITILEKGKDPVKVSKGAIQTNGAFKNFLQKVKGTRDSMVLFLIRRSGNESYLWAVAEAETKYQVRTGKLPVPNDGELDLSLFD